MQDYSLGDVARILKVSPRRLRYWQKTQLVESLSFEADEAGYAFRDLVCLRTIVSLLEKGVPLQRIRRHLEILRDRLPELDDPAAALRLWDEQSDRLAVRHDGRLEDASGQLLLEFPSPGPDETDAVAPLDPPAAGGHSDGSLDAADSRGTGWGPSRRPSPDEPVPLFPVTPGGDEAAGEALAWFERGCEIDAEPARWEEAIEAYETALALEPAYADAYCNLGAIRYNQGRRAEARNDFESCLEHEPDHVEANFNLANVLEEEGDDRLALSHYRRALASDPLYPDLHINLALIYEKLDRRVQSLRHWRRYLQIEPSGSWADVAKLRLDRREAPGTRAGSDSAPSTPPVAAD